MTIQSTSETHTSAGTGRSSTRILAWAISFILVMSCVLLALHIADPWQFLHDDNGAWFSATARTHLLRGLAETKGQDFFLVKATNELRPYLHHPPFISLYLAAAFQLAGMDTPQVARMSVAMLHLVSMLIFVQLARMILGSAMLPNLWAVFVYALVPMSVFFGKMPDHEVPGLLFLNLAVYMSLCAAQHGAGGRHNFVTVFCAWFLVPLASWHATLCGFVFVLVFSAVSEPEHRRTFRLASYGALLMALALAVVHLLWANNWRLLPSQQTSLAHWFVVPQGMHALSFWVKNLGIAAKHGRRFFANIPWVLSVGWVVWVAIRAIKRRGLLRAELVALSLGMGSMLYCVIFSQAVRIHAYQQFYFLPFLALSSALAVSRLHGGLLRYRKAAAVLFLVVIAAATVESSLHRLVRLYRAPDSYAVKASRDIEEQFY